MIRRFIAFAICLVAIGAAGFWVLTMPGVSGGTAITGLKSGDAAKGEQIFWAGGCSSCHARPGTTGSDKLLLTGGVRLATEFGTFVTPNISPDNTDGIGNWSVDDLANAMRRGVNPSGHHLYPAFPYTSYVRMTDADIADLYAFLHSLPPAGSADPPNELSFPFNIRRGIGLWKLLYLDPDPVVAIDGSNALLARGRYLVEGPGHCGECHTPRDRFGGLERGKWLSGAISADGKGKVPNITPGKGGIGDWSAKEIADFLETGFTPEFDTAGGVMTEVQENMARLPAEDREAIAAYLKAVPPLPTSYADK
jgi:mono/diheme cytochrome c family protein